MKFSGLILIPLVLVLLTCNAASMDTLHIPSKALGKTRKVCVAVPESYGKESKRYSVVYLLHGAGGNHAVFLKKLKDTLLIQQMADELQVLIVMPDADTMSYYVNSRKKGGAKIESYLAKELVPAIDKKYRTSANRSHRGLVGFSMGGHGALYLASQYRRLFCAAASMSGAVDLNTQHWKRDAKFRRVRDSTFNMLMGPKGPDTANPYPTYSAISRIEQLGRAKLAIKIDCGTEDFLIEPNRVLRDRLIKANIAHTYTECPGKHDWTYWSAHLGEQVRFVVEAMGQRK